MVSEATPWEFEAGHEPVVLVRTVESARFAVGERPGVLRIEAEGDRALHFDPEGRVIQIQEEGCSYRRTLDHRLLASRIVREGGRRRGWRRVAVPEDSLGFLEAAHRDARRIREAVLAGAGLEVLAGELEDPAAWLAQRLEGAARWDRSRLRRDAEALRQLYLPIPILPPDHYASLVLQVTDGCAWNRCGFCDFYRDRPYRERGVDEFLAHVDAVREHLGGSLARLHRVFLGQANALLVENEKLIPMLEGVRARIPMLPREAGREERRTFREDHRFWIDGFYSFLDGFHRQKSAPEYAALAGLGLRRVYLGLESGSAEVLRRLDKPPTVDAAIELVHALREAGIFVGVILLIGAGGRSNAKRHLEETLHALRRMELRRGDQVYLSRLVVHEGGPYEERARRDGLAALDRGEQDLQIQAFTNGVREHGAQGPSVAPYEIELSRSLVSWPER